MPLLVGLCALVGLAVGSFLNVVVWRVPRGESVVRPPSACPACGAPVRPADNVPVLSWLRLRGRCRDCSAPISPRYPLVEVGTAALFVVMALRFGLDPVLPAYLYLAAVGLALALMIPMSGWATASLTGGTPEPVRVIEVAPGDTLYGIAGDLAEPGEVREMVHRIQELNALPSAGLSVGQRIAVPVE